MDVKRSSAAGAYELLKQPRIEPTRKLDHSNSERSTTESIQRQSEKGSEKVSRADLEEQIEGMNQMLDLNFTSLKFNVHEDLDRLFVQVVNRDTDEVIREVPPEQFLDMVASMLEHVGLLIDERI
ncbi:flagellar protein FlaG [Desertibacillus haloalkaliphilus]|uniref:flagellar protein FlaG n=1 Tax=Desertibacillus haloalkaliphilus TaxID=1328930 RepID=UPI0028B05E45|nr:flagellar protein FlaG [Desertibacillus haloalkaliphilus]